MCFQRCFPSTDHISAGLFQGLILGDLVRETVRRVLPQLYVRPPPFKEQRGPAGIGPRNRSLRSPEIPFTKPTNLISPRISFTLQPALPLHPPTFGQPQLTITNTHPNSIEFIKKASGLFYRGRRG